MRTSSTPCDDGNITRLDTELSGEMGAGTQEALAYARQFFPAFRDTFMPEVKQLMGTMLFHGRPLQGTPYHVLSSPCLLDEVATDFVRAACGILAQVSPLYADCRHVWVAWRWQTSNMLLGPGLTGTT